MKTKFLLGIAIIVALLIPSKGVCQLSRGEWSYGVVFETDNFIYNLIGTNLRGLPATIAYAIGEDKFEKTSEFYAKNLWWIPDFRYRANIVQKLEFANGNAVIHPKAWGFGGIDWGFNNYAVGYHVGYLSRTNPFGFDLQVSYWQDGYKIDLPQSDMSMKIVKRMVSTALLGKIRIGKYESSRINPILEIGASYNYAFHYHDDFINDKDAVNNGFNGIVGLGFTNTETHLSWSLRYEHSFFNFYNRDFTYEGQKIFDGSKSRFGRLGIALSYGF